MYTASVSSFCRKADRSLVHLSTLKRSAVACARPLSTSMKATTFELPAKNSAGMVQELAIRPHPMTPHFSMAGLLGWSWISDHRLYGIGRLDDVIHGLVGSIN